MPTPVSTPASRSKALHRNILLTILGLLVIVGGVGAYARWKAVQTPAASQADALQTAVVQRGDLKIFASGTGTLIAGGEATFGFSESGTVAEVLVQVGDVVDAGQALARLDDASAQRQLLQAQRALAELTSPTAVAAAKLALAEAKVNLVNTKATLAYLISPDVLYWEEQVAAAEKALEQAKAEAAANPSEDADKKVAAAEQLLQVCINHLAQATLDYWNDYVPETFLTTVTEGRETKKQVVPPSEEDVAQARADYELAKQQLQEAEWYLAAITAGEIPEGATGAALAAFEQAQDDLAAAQESLAATTLCAPIHGTVMAVGFQTGDSAGSGATITVSNLDQPYTLEIYLDESDWGSIKAGYPVEVTFDLLPDKVYAGKVLSVDPGLTTSMNSSYIRAIVQLDASIGTDLPLGTGASVDVIGGRTEGALLIPVEALHEIEDGTYAVFVMENGEPRLRVVEIGLQDLVYVEVTSGLREGDVVTTGITETN
ncbi:MAG: HlyD family efflux transporter periplasmic adaptor subunit [Anaerolineales bacterium]|nr:HlyD family efflux transporter periplasmic adaptor subunit [Anaerolineales bacterium]